MKTTEQSIKALMWQIESGKLKSDMAKILKYAKEGYGFNADQVRAHFRFNKKSTCNARISELQDLGLLKPVGKLKADGFDHTIFVYVGDPEEQKILRKQRRIDKFWKILYRLRYDFPDLCSENGLEL